MADSPRKLFGFIWIALIALKSGGAGVVYGEYVLAKNSVLVIVPDDLISFHDASIASFGVPDYPGSIVGSVVYPSKGANSCIPFDGDKIFKSNTSLPTILIVERGECYFAKKVWNAQQAGASAVLIADYIDEPLLTTSNSSSDDRNVDKINIPSAIINKSFGDFMKEALESKKEVVIKLEWPESVRNADRRVEYQYCPLHYYVDDSQCNSRCINHGRYCALDPAGDSYQGKDVVIENLRQLCVHRVAKAENRSWVWWDYVTDFHIGCSMKEDKYSKTCAEDVLKSLNLPVDKIRKCMGDPAANMENVVLKNEQEVQIGHGGRGDVNILPTLIINDIHYRGKLERSAVLKAICAVFKETTNPPACSTSYLKTNSHFSFHQTLAIARAANASARISWVDTIANVAGTTCIWRKMIQLQRNLHLEFHGSYHSYNSSNHGGCCSSQFLILQNHKENLILHETGFLKP